MIYRQHPLEMPPEADYKQLQALPDFDLKKPQALCSVRQMPPAIAVFYFCFVVADFEWRSSPNQFSGRVAAASPGSLRGS
jgi:hypothetical protein